MNRLLYIDNLRIGLIILVVLHHLAITYGGPGGWYYIENSSDEITTILYSIFIATNQAFFMGFFFFIAAYFTAMSIEKKKLAVFIQDRLTRLGVPLLLVYFLLNPFTIYLVKRYAKGDIISFYDAIGSGRYFGFGPLWFVEALLYFTAFYILYRAVFSVKQKLSVKLKKLPSNQAVLLFALMVGMLTFVVRLRFSVGYVFQPLGFQPPHFSQYIALFVLGIMAYRNNWLEAISYQLGKRWLVFAILMIFIGFPLLFISGGAASGNLDPFMGGATWQSLGYSVWEQLVGFSLIVGLLGIFRKKFNTQSEFTKKLSAAAYTVFIIHAAVLVGACVALKKVEVYHLFKFLMLAPVVVVLCFSIAVLLRKLPMVGRVL